MAHALIIGHTGQDGRLLHDQLVARGDGVTGVTRSIDLLDRRRLCELVSHTIPDEVYYLAAHHHSSQDSSIHEADVWRNSWDVHVHGFGGLLAALVECRPAARVFYAASSRVFGRANSTFQNENSPRRPEDPYGVTKAAGMMVADYYRRTHDLFVSCGILFNHESPLRGPQFVTQRVVRGLVAIRRGQAETLELGNLDARVDWGYAPDYTLAMQAMLALEVPDDYVVATGETHSVREWVEIAAALLSLDWKAHVHETGELLHRPPQALCGDATRLRRATGWAPSIGFHALVEHLVTAALASSEAG